MEEKYNILFYSVNFAFILTNFYGFLLKWFYKPKAYAEGFGKLFPGQRMVGTLYLLQLYQLETEKIYLSPHLTVEQLLKHLPSNRNYLSETIVRIGYKSFYDMVNSFRVRHAIQMIKDKPDEKMITIAYDCGFSMAFT